MRKRRLLQLAVAILLPIGIIGLLVAHGCERDRDKLADLVARLERPGGGASLDDLIAAAPPVDADRQRRLWDWTRQRRKFDAGDYAIDAWWPHGDESRWQGREVTRRAEEERAWMEDVRPDMLRLAEMLREGEACLTANGWIAADAEQFRTEWYGMLRRLPRTASHSALLSAHHWFGAAALHDASPDAPLDALDRLHAALRRPLLTHEVLLAGGCSVWRDSTYLLLALAGRLPTERLDAWAGESPEEPVVWADGLRGDLVMWDLPTARDLLARRFSLFRGAFGQEPALFENPGDWTDRRVLGPTRWSADWKSAIEEKLAREACFRGTGNAKDALDAAHRLESLGWPFDDGSSRRALLRRLLAHRIRHRAFRAAALLASRPEGLGNGAALLASGPWDVALRVDRFAAGVLRIAADPTSPVPELIDPSDVHSGPPPPPEEDGPFLRWNDTAVCLRVR